MQTKTATIVVTTIFDPCLLDGYRDNLEHWGRLDDVEVIVIPDKNTPHSAYRRCQDLADKGLKIQCPTIEEQEAFLTAVGINPQLIPYNSDNRRNVGYLMAYRSGRDFLISIDDDNHCRPDEDFVGEHSIVCSSHAHEAVESATGYLNICNLLQFEKPAADLPARLSVCIPPPRGNALSSGQKRSHRHQCRALDARPRHRWHYLARYKTARPQL